MTRIAFVLVFAATSFAQADEDATGIEFFEKKIRPVLVDSCYKCHSSKAKNVKGGLLLDSRSALLKGGDSGDILSSGKPQDSLLLDALRFDGLKMPPSGRLPETVTADFKKWIVLGAPYPEGRATPDHPRQQEKSDHWAFQPLQQAPIPPLRDSDWHWTDIDRLALGQLQSHQTRPPADADAETLVRRIYFDVIGLPPSPAEIEQFTQHAKNNRRGAIAELVDRLLTKPQFGERWARDWLDLARFSESNGGDRNVVWRHAWRYRNWVIDALNEDKPYNRFVQEQIAGDLLPAATSEVRDKQLVATGFLTLGPKLFMETKSERFRMDRVDEQIDIVTRAVLGLTVSCARCHDHKFDPIPTRDYYALAGIFRSTYLLYGTAAPAGNQYGHDRPLQPIGKDSETLEGPAQAWKKRVADQIAARNKARSDRYRVVRGKAANQNKLKMLEQTAGQDKLVLSLIQEIEKQTVEITVWDDKIKAMDAELKQLEDNPPPLPDYAMAARDAAKPADSQIRIRGVYNKLGKNVPRGMLTLLPGVPALKIPSDDSGRLQLARWLTASQNPLTPRVAVNRIWQHLLGEGLVRTPDNFGTLGIGPLHPALLDNLALRFQQDGWSTKRLIRAIMTSRVYQLSSRKRSADAEPHLGLLPTPRLLPAESLRDAILTVSGELDLSRPSASVVSAIEAPEFNDRVKLTAEQLEHTHRSIYLPVVRNWLPKMMAKFDFADPSLLIARRERRTMLSQQLFMMNNPFVIRHAQKIAERILSEADESARVQLVYQHCFGRLPSDDEIQLSQTYLQNLQQAAAEKDDGETESAAWAGLCQALLSSAEFRLLY